MDCVCVHILALKRVTKQLWCPRTPRPPRVPLSIYISLFSKIEHDVCALYEECIARLAWPIECVHDQESALRQKNKSITEIIVTLFTYLRLLHIYHNNATPLLKKLQFSVSPIRKQSQVEKWCQDQNEFAQFRNWDCQTSQFPNWDGARLGPDIYRYHSNFPCQFFHTTCSNLCVLRQW